MWVSNLQTSAVMVVYKLVQQVIKPAFLFACTKFLVQLSAFVVQLKKLGSYGRRTETHHK